MTFLKCYSGLKFKNWSIEGESAKIAALHAACYQGEIDAGATFASVQRKDNEAKQVNVETPVVTNRCRHCVHFSLRARSIKRAFATRGLLVRNMKY